MPSTAPSCAIVIFGASGDLAQRKLIPALYEMAREKLLNELARLEQDHRAGRVDDRRYVPRREELVTFLEGSRASPSANA